MSRSRHAQNRRLARRQQLQRLVETQFPHLRFKRIIQNRANYLSQTGRNRHFYNRFNPSNYDAYRSKVARQRLFLQNVMAPAMRRFKQDKQMLSEKRQKLLKTGMVY